MTWLDARVGVAVASCLALLGSCSSGSDGSGGAGGGGATAPPVAITLGYQTVSASQETLSGSLHPGGQDTEYWFEWGPDAALASPSKTATQLLPAASSAQPVSGIAVGLAAGTKLHYRLAARNAAGTAQGQVKPCFHHANVVFATSVEGTGNLGSWADAGGKTGREAGDAICQAHAGRAGLQGTFKAWLSDSAGAPVDRLARSAVPYMKVDGTRIGNSWSDFTASPYLDGPLNMDELGGPKSTWVHTETRVGGTTAIGLGGNACRDWTSAAGADYSVGGSNHYQDYRWTELGLHGCGNAAPLYCFQQALDLPQEHCSTGCAGPIGWVWHVSACSKGLFQDAECRYVCCNFYKGTSNCNVIPASFGGYTVTACSYDTGRYSMAVTRASASFTVTCEVE